MKGEGHNERMREKGERGEIFSHGNHHSHSISHLFIDFNLNYKKNNIFHSFIKENNISHSFTKGIIFFIDLQRK